ncbi:MAG: hypothetical protein PWP23_3161 [Candidatus Sumerlaeota bacterium]|nr:hypothetical protein [Candidatus Sumerlaeota bacterium]
MHVLLLLLQQYSQNTSGGGDVAFGGLFMLCCMVFSFVIGIASLVFWIWMLVDCATKEPSTGNDKLIWILVIIFLQGIGALLYFFIRRPTRIREYGQ